jgi:hypothetical protein
MQMREGIRTVVAGFAMAFGIAWLVLAMLFLGSLVLRSSEARNLANNQVLIGVIAGFVVWVCGVVLVVAYAVSIVRERYGPALVAGAAPLIAMYVTARVPINDTEYADPVLTVGYAVAAAFTVVLVTGAIGWALSERRHARWVSRHSPNSRWVPPIPV